MNDPASPSSRKLTAALLTLALVVGACGGAAGPTPSNGASTPTPGESAGGGGGSSGETSVTGSLVSSGAYAATWTWQPGNAANVGIGGVTLNSDKGTFGNVEVLADGSITFTSGAPELTSGSYKGTGAQVHLKKVGGADLPCSFTLDNDVTGSDGSVIHLTGTLTMIGTPFDC